MWFHEDGVGDSLDMGCGVDDVNVDGGIRVGDVELRGGRRHPGSLIWPDLGVSPHIWILLRADPLLSPERRCLEIEHQGFCDVLFPGVALQQGRIGLSGHFPQLLLDAIQADQQRDITVATVWRALALLK